MDNFFASYNGGGGGGGVTTINGLAGAVTLVAGTGITITPSGSNLTIAATGSGANVFLSNLTSPTAINQDLIFATGTNAILQQSTIGSTLTVGTINAPNNNSSDLILSTGNAPNNNTGNIYLRVGFTPDGLTGKIIANTSLDMSGFSVLNVANLANPSLTNLTPTAINQDLVFNKANAILEQGLPDSNLSILTNVATLPSPTPANSINITAGNSADVTTTDVGGGIVLTAGSSPAVGIGGDITLNVGSGDVANGFIIPNGTIRFNTVFGANIYTINETGGAQSGSMTLATGSQNGTANSGSTLIKTGQTNSGTANSGQITLSTGDANTGTSGDIIIQPGTSNTLRGNIVLRDGTEGTAGRVWTSTDTTGRGAWVAAPAAGANVFLSNLTSPTAINQDLLPNGSLTLGSTTLRWNMAFFQSNGIAIGTTNANQTVYNDSQILNTNASAPDLDIVARGIRLFPTGFSQAASPKLTLYNQDASRFLTIASPTGTFTSFDYTLPSTAPTTGQVLSSSNTGVMSWVTPTTTGASGTFISADAKTITVVNGLITSIV